MPSSTLLLLPPPAWGHRDFTNPVVPHILRDSQATVIDEHGHYITIGNPLARFKYPVREEQ